MQPRALLLDVDGTLVDSMYHHVATWARALDEAGAPVPQHEIHARIGKDGSTLVNELLDCAGVAEEAHSEIADRAKELHGEYFAAEADADRLRLLPGARDLVRGAHERGVIVVLATSAPPSEFDHARRLLDVDDVVDAVTTSEDVDQAKPDPTIVEIALERSGVDAGEAVMVGDTTWDAIAATKVGVRCFGVRTGGIAVSALLSAGFERVVDDPGAVLALLDEGASSSSGAGPS